MSAEVMHRRALHRCLRTAPSLAGIRRALRAGLGRALRRSRWRAPLEPSAAASSPFAEPNVVPPVEPSAAASSPSRSPAARGRIRKEKTKGKGGEERNPRARQASPSRDLDAQQPEAIGMAMALRSLAGKLRPPVAATLRRAPASSSFHPEEKLSSMTSSKTKTPVDDNCFELLGDKYFEERSRIFAQLVKEDARYYGGADRCIQEAEEGNGCF
ncbi:hypothetical protein DAI22_07g026750 [Oryza sativa Japonica Group]|nr:hypothetical protein DAI22_07g026750 [Oryza sativa Japonica Group]